MSHTEIYRIPNAGPIEIVGEAGNAWRGAMQLWDYIWNKYFFPSIEDELPEDVKQQIEHTPNQEGKDPYEEKAAYAKIIITMTEASKFPELNRRFWDVYKRNDVEWWEKVLMIATYDKVMILKPELPALIFAMQKYVAMRDTSNYEEQIPVLQQILEDPDAAGVCFNQTSVCGDAWEVYENNLEYNKTHVEEFLEDGEVDHYRTFEYPRDIKQYGAWDMARDLEGVIPPQEEWI